MLAPYLKQFSSFILKSCEGDSEWVASTLKRGAGGGKIARVRNSHKYFQDCMAVNR